MRKFLITKFICAKCGRNLSLTYAMPKGASKYEDGEPTGSEMVEHRVAVEPCETCFHPLTVMKYAAKVLLDA